MDRRIRKLWMFRYNELCAYIQEVQIQCTTCLYTGVSDTMNHMSVNTPLKLTVDQTPRVGQDCAKLMRRLRLGDRDRTRWHSGCIGQR